MRQTIRPIILLAMALLGATVVVATVPHVAMAHNGEIPPVPPSPPKRPVDLRHVRAPRWSWIHWWEANRERYLTAPQQASALQPPATQQLDPLHAAAAKELLPILSMENARPSLAIEAALALGKMRHEPALPALVALADKAAKPEVRRAAIVAIGLLGTPAAEKELARVHPNWSRENSAVIVAMGLLPTASAGTLHQLRTQVSGDSLLTSTEKPGPSSVLMWALRQHQKEKNLEYFRGQLKTSSSPWVAAEALVGLGGTKDHAAQRLLEDALFGTALADVKAAENLDSLLRFKYRQATGTGTTVVPDGKGGVAIRQGTGLVKKQGGRGVDIRPGAGPVGNAPERDEDRERDETERTGSNIEVEPERIAMAWLQTSAAIGLGEIDVPRVADALIRFLDEDDVRSPELLTPKCFAIMSMASYPTPATRDRLISVLAGRPRDDRNRERRAGDVPKDSPLRGFAALGLGLYARPYKTDQGMADRPGFDTAAMTLVERLEDDREEEEVRTACAVALGLTQRSAVLPVFHRATAKLQQRNRRVDFPMVGFLLLGRALAGDQSLIEPAGQFLLNRDDDPSPGGILSRRAAVLALGLTRSGNAIPVLTKAWHLNHYVNREVILALRLVGGTNAAEPVMQRLRESRDDEERAYMAQALGELLAAERPTTLDRLTAGCNFTVRNDDMRPLQALANGFLYDYLIASFGDNW